MKHERKDVSVRQGSVWAIVALGIFFASSCNSRPPYFKELWQLRTDCDGGLTLVYEDDTDPDYRRMTLIHSTDEAARGARFRALTRDGGGETLVLTSGTRCLFPHREDPATCIDASGKLLTCRAAWKLLEYRKPTVNPERHAVPVPSDYWDRDVFDDNTVETDVSSSAGGH